jgi:WD40 repeat protein
MRESRVPENRDGYRYSAFISYKHGASSDFARALELALKNYAKPILARPARVFRDERHFAPGPSLPRMISSALKASEYLILLATPTSARSDWVIGELKEWCLDLGRADRLIIVLLEGSIAVDSRNKVIDWRATDAIPATLSEFMKDVPHYLDLHELRDGTQLTLNNPTFKNAVNAISASLRGVDPNDMLGVENVQHRRNIRVRNYGILLLLIAAGVATASAVVATQQATIAEEAKREAVSQRNGAETQRGIAVANEALAKDAQQTAVQQQREAEASEKRAREAERLAVERELKTRKLSYNTNLQAAHSAIARGSFKLAEELLDRDVPRPGQIDIRSIDWYHLWSLIHQEDGTAAWPGQNVVFTAPTDELTTFVVQNGSGRVSRELRKIDLISGHDVDRPWSLPCPAYRVVRLLGGDSALLACLVVGPEQTMRTDIYFGSRRSGLTKLAGASSLVTAMAVSASTRRVALGFQDGSLGILRLEGTEIEPLPGLRRSAVHSLAFSPDGFQVAASHKLFVPGEDVGGITIWDLREKKHRAIKAQFVETVAWSADGEVFAASSMGQGLRFWRLRDGAMSRADINGKALSTCGPGLFAVAGVDGTIHLVNIDSRAVVGGPLRSHSSPIVALACSESGDALMSLDEAGVMKGWDLGRSRRNPYRDSRLLPFRRSSDSSAPWLHTARFSPSGKYVGFQDNSRLSVWKADLEGREPRSCELCLHADSSMTIGAFGFDHEDNLVATVNGLGSSSVRMWKLAQWAGLDRIRCRAQPLDEGKSSDGRPFACSRELRRYPPGMAPAFALSPDGRKVATSQGIFDLASDKFPGEAASRHAPRFSADGERVVLLDGTRRPSIIDVKSARRGPRLDVDVFDPVHGVELAGNILYVRSDKLTLREVSGPFAVRTPVDAERATTGLAATPDGRTVLTLSHDGLQFRDAESGEIRFEIPKLDSMATAGKAFALAVSPDGTKIAVMGSDGAGRVLFVPSVADLAAHAVKVARLSPKNAEAQLAAVRALWALHLRQAQASDAGPLPAATLVSARTILHSPVLRGRRELPEYLAGLSAAASSPPVR